MADLKLMLKEAFLRGEGGLFSVFFRFVTKRYNKKPP